MKLARLLPLALLAAGSVAALTAIACGGDSNESEATATATQAQASRTATRTATAAASRTPSPTNTPTAIPTPTPYDGQVMRIRMPKFGIDAPIENLAINTAGELDTPKAENTNVGWYFIYDKPGRLNPDNRGWVDWGGKTQVSGFLGNSVFSAHVYYGNVPAPFQRLAQSVAGDEVIVTMEDGREYTYVVFSNERYHRDTIDMGKVIWPQEKPEDEEWVTLITCGGQLDSTGQEYLSRDVILAKRKP